MTNDESNNHSDTEYVVLWERWLQSKGLDAEAIRGEIDRWSLDGVTQVDVGNHARTMPAEVVRGMVEQALTASVRTT
jgi:hypothetical protein